MFTTDRELNNEEFATQGHGDHITPEQTLIQSVVALAIETVRNYQEKGSLPGLPKRMWEKEYEESRQCLEQIDDNFLNVAGFKRQEELKALIDHLLNGQPVSSLREASN